MGISRSAVRLSNTIAPAILRNQKWLRFPSGLDRGHTSLSGILIIRCFACSQLRALPEAVIERNAGKGKGVRESGSERRLRLLWRHSGVTG